MSVRIAVFASGSGSNLQALLDHFSGPAAELATVALVVSDRPAAGALDRARGAGVEARVVPVAGREPADVADEMLAALLAARIDIVVLAGFLRLMPAPVVETFRDRILNIHPALLPAFGGHGMYGLRVHRAVLEAGCQVTGPTIHFVDERYDTGRTLLQWPVPVLAGDTPESLAARVLGVEHRILPAAVEALARAVRGGEAVRAFTAEAGAAFSLVLRDAPAVDGIRRVLGLDQNESNQPIDTTRTG